MERVNIAEKFARFPDQWQPKIVAELNGQEVKLVKVQGTFPWHCHDDVDEMFLVRLRSFVMAISKSDLPPSPRMGRKRLMSAMNFMSSPPGKGTIGWRIG
jgi:hypothetical protein